MKTACWADRRNIHSGYAVGQQKGILHTMKRIGFVDYYISEWHANNYPAWFEEANQKLGLDYKVSYAWAELDAAPVSGETTDEWCARMGVEHCQTIEELCEKSDIIVVLAPSNPEKHLQYAKAVLPYGKRTYIDKTFAPDFATAQEIFAIAAKYNTPFFSSSALRYAEELADFAGGNNIILTGGGRSLEEYSIHLIEMAVSLLKNPAKRVLVERLGEQRICHVVSENGSKAAILYSPAMRYSVTANKADGTLAHQDITSAFFLNLIADMLTFFETGSASFDPGDFRSYEAA